MLAFYLTLIDEPSDKEKFANIYSSYKEKMYHEAMSILNNHSLAEEAIQDSLLKIAKNISDFSDMSKNKTASLITIIVRNVSIDIMRTEHIDEKLSIDDDIADISADILGQIISDEGYGELLSYFQNIDPKYKDVISLRLAYGYGYDEVSELLNIPKRTAETRYYRGMKKIREELEARYGKR